MRKIEIEVSDADYQKAKDLLENLKYVKVIRDKRAIDDVTLLSQASLAEDVEEQRERIIVSKSQNNDPADEAHSPMIVDEVTLMSQPSLAEEWDSEEDAVWDQYYKETKPARDSASKS